MWPSVAWMQYNPFPYIPHVKLFQLPVNTNLQLCALLQTLQTHSLQQLYSTPPPPPPFLKIMWKKWDKRLQMLLFKNEALAKQVPLACVINLQSLNFLSALTKRFSIIPVELTGSRKWLWSQIWGYQQFHFTLAPGIHETKNTEKNAQWVIGF